MTLLQMQRCLSLSVLPDYFSDIYPKVVGDYESRSSLLKRKIGRFGRPAFTFDRLSWITRITKNEMIRIGRFKYDMPGKRLMSPDLKGVLKPSSNILAFQSKFTLYPVKSRASWIFEYVFPDQAGFRVYNELAETTSLQREVKALYLKGGYIHEFCGFFF